MKIKNTKLIFFVIWLFPSFTSKAQETFNLIDSLITAHSFPIQAPCPSQSLAGKQKLYSFIIPYSTPKTVNYILGDPGTVYGTKNYLNIQDCISDSIVHVPRFHLVFFSLRMFRRKDNNYKYLNFFIDHFFKNAGDSNIYLKDRALNLTIYNSNGQVKSSTKFYDPLKEIGPLSPKEGWISTGLNEMDYSTKIPLWNHFNPNLHYYTIEVLSQSDKPYEYYHGRIGFRDIRLQKNQLLINNNKLEFKTALLNAESDDFESHLLTLKRNNLNTIFLNSPLKAVYDLCDSIGLNVIQELNASSFRSLPELLEYFVSIKDNPSFIAWYDNGFNHSWINILHQLDPYRPLIKDKSFFEPIIENWPNLNANEKIEIKKRCQIFGFYFIPVTSVLKVQMEEPFGYLDKIELNWRVLKNDSVIARGEIQYVKFERGKTEVKIPMKVDRSPDVSYEFELVITENSYPFKKGDVIALSKFQYVLKDGKLVYKVIY